MKYLLEQLTQAVELYNETANEELDLYEVLDSLNSMSQEEIEQALKELKPDDETQLNGVGCTEIEPYKLINNYGYKFRKSGFKQNLKHTLKEYGADVDYWEIDNKKFDTFTEALNYIKEL